MSGGHPVQERICDLEDAETAARLLRDRALDLALRQTSRRPGRPLPALAERAVLIALALHERAERAARELEECINYLEAKPS
ncbi:hypothetical protein ACFVFJ_46920 [Streptomyces sp. NPDC057717]|uniref:hypothetical protein n=1 Tax=Streptomyces sp. NPDC057717 TaxID=3346224 RepID=UPI0036C766F2